MAEPGSLLTTYPVFPPRRRGPRENEIIEKYEALHRHLAGPFTRLPAHPVPSATVVVAGAPVADEKSAREFYLQRIRSAAPGLPEDQTQRLVDAFVGQAHAQPQGVEVLLAKESATRTNKTKHRTHS